jgi:hypothetical protein
MRPVENILKKEKGRIKESDGKGKFNQDKF